jgi:hypothetical protein
VVHDLGSMGRREPRSVAPTKFVDPNANDWLGCVRSLVWSAILEIVTCIGAIAV